MIYPRKAYRVEFMNLNALCAYAVEMFFPERTIVGGIAECVEQSPYLYAFFCLLSQDAEEKVGNGVVPKIEIFQMDGMSGLSDSLKHVVELLLPVHQKGHGVVVREGHSLRAKRMNNSRICTLGKSCCRI